jgi:hypothetical protein
MFVYIDDEGLVRSSEDNQILGRVTGKTENTLLYSKRALDRIRGAHAGSKCTHVHVEAPEGTILLHDVLYEYAGCFGNLDDTYVGLDLNELATRADAMDKIESEAIERKQRIAWNRIKDLITAARADGVGVLILGW